MTGVADNASIGAGFEGPNDSVSPMNQIAFAIKQFLLSLDLMKPVVVKAVHPGSGSPPGPTTVDVLPLVQQVTGGGNPISQGLVSGVQVFRLTGGPWQFVVDPAVGDLGWVVAGDRDISKVVANRGEAPPGSGRYWNVSDGCYLGGGMNAAPGAYFWAKSDGTFNLTTKDGVVVQSDGSGNLQVTATKVTINGDLHVTGAVIGGFGGADQVGLQTHEHSANNTPPTPGS